MLSYLNIMGIGFILLINTLALGGFIQRGDQSMLMPVQFSDKEISEKQKKTDGDLNNCDKYELFAKPLECHKEIDLSEVDKDLTYEI